MSEWDTIFQPGLRHWKEWQDWQEDEILEAPAPGPGPMEVDLDSGVIYIQSDDDSAPPEVP